jgi:hypothetical protein
VVAVYDEGWSLRGLAFFVGLGVVKVRPNVVGAGSIYPWCGKRLHNLRRLRRLPWKAGLLLRGLIMRWLDICSIGAVR